MKERHFQGKKSPICFTKVLSRLDTFRQHRPPVSLFQIFSVEDRKGSYSSVLPSTQMRVEWMRRFKQECEESVRPEWTKRLIYMNQGK